jgi:hypothetical protein
VGGVRGRGLNAGDASGWLAATDAVLRGEAEADVPCDGCTACCTSSQFVHVGRDELDAVAHIPRELLFPAPGRRDLLVIGYDERGHCPMLVDGTCSIYEHRPRTCRDYDCRVFVAAGVAPDRPAIADRVQQWDFTSDADGAAALAAVRAAAVFVAARRSELGEAAPATPTQLAVAAVGLRDLFAGGDPDPTTVRVELQRRRVSSR